MAKVCLIEILFCIVAVSIVSTRALQLGRCPYVRPKADFNVSQSLGTWYEYAKYPIPNEHLAKCITNKVGQSENGGKITLRRTLTSKITGLETGVTARLVVSAPGTLQIIADGIAGILGDDVVSVLDTDYVNYAVIFSCEEILGLGVFHDRYAFILTRERQPNGDAVDNAKNALRNNGLSVRNLANTDQLNCPNAN